MKQPINYFKNFFPIISGLEIGIPLNLLSKVSTQAYFGQSLLDTKNIALNFLFGFVTYKQDRLSDAIEYYNSTSIISLNNDKNPKEKYYLSLIENKNEIELTLIIATFILISYSIIEKPIVLPLYISTLNYKFIKTETYFKSLYISFMWTICSCILPLDNTHLHSIDFTEYLPTFLSIFASTNYADIKDYDEDLSNQVKTLPILLGITETKILVIMTAFLSNIIFLSNDYSLQEFQDYLFIVGNTIPYFL